jgi:hypothetical protein
VLAGKFDFGFTADWMRAKTWRSAWMSLIGRLAAKQQS